MDEGYVIRNGKGEEICFDDFEKGIEAKENEVKQYSIEQNLNGPNPKKFLIISIEDSTLEKPRFWRANAKGYTYKIEEAGE